MSEYRNILLCVAGTTPQIITEVLYALTQQRRERVDEVRIVTTLQGQEKLLKCLLDPHEGKFFAFCKDYGIDPKSIQFDHTSITTVQTPDGRALDDIRLKDENERTADRICEIVRELAKMDNVRIHASAAGGRKTMGIFLASAMQLFGRRRDVLSHVLVNDPFENHPDFYYIPPEPITLELKDKQGNVTGYASTATAHIELADIPFIRLRGLRSDWLNNDAHSYGKLVEQAQRDLDLSESLHDLRIDLRRRVVSVANHSVKLPKREFLFFAFFARLRKEAPNQDGAGFIAPKDITGEALDPVFRIITSAGGKERTLDEFELVAGYDFIRKLLSDLNENYESFLQTLLQVKSKINRKFEDAGFRDCYRIGSSGGYGETRYGLSIAPDHIVFR